MESISQWLAKNAEWIFSGVGAALIVAFFGLLNRRKQDSAGSNTDGAPVVVHSNQSMIVNAIVPDAGSQPSRRQAKQKGSVAILFVDDDVKFQVVNILKRNGWTNTKIINDIVSLEQPEVAIADIFFIDIQGVGVSLGFKDQGLGLVVALRKKYPDKRIAIYSAENANAFHAAFGLANERISKDADPYEFMEAVERMSE